MKQTSLKPFLCLTTFIGCSGLLIGTLVTEHPPVALSLNNRAELSSNSNIILLVQARNQQEQEADQLLQRGINQFRPGKFQDNLLDFQKAQSIYQETSNTVGVLVTTELIGYTYSALNDIESAINSFEQALAIAQNTSDPKLQKITQFIIANSTNNLGISYMTLGQFQYAMEWYNKSLIVLQEMENSLGELIVLDNLMTASGYFLNPGVDDTGEKIWQQIKMLNEEIQNKISKKDENINSFYTVSPSLHFLNALEFYLQVFQIEREINTDQTLPILVDHLLISSYMEFDTTSRELTDSESLKIRNKKLEKIDIYQQFLHQSRNTGNQQGEMLSLVYLTILYSSVGNFYWFQCEQASHFEPPKSSFTSPCVQGIKFYKKSLKSSRKIGLLSEEHGSLFWLGMLHNLLRKNQEAFDYFQEAAKIMQELGSYYVAGRDFYQSGASAVNLGKLAEAEQAFLSSIKNYESVRQGTANDTDKIYLLSSQQHPYRVLTQILVYQNKIKTALEVTERARSRALNDILRQRFNEENTDNLTLKIPTIEEIQEVAKTYNATLVQYSFLYETEIGNTNAGIHTNRSDEPVLYIWVIQPTGEVEFRRSDSIPSFPSQRKHNTPTTETVLKSRNILRSASSTGGQKVSPYLQQMYEQLIYPIADLLPKNPEERVIFVPQSYLSLIPFPALQDGSGKYLIEKHTILTAPSIQTLQFIEQRRKALREESVPSNKNILVVGNPQMPSVSIQPGKPPVPLPQLPESEVEANIIAALLNTSPLIGNQATKSTIIQKMKNAHIIHIATHGLLNEEQGLESAIALTPSAHDNGLLTADEISYLQLKAELVVLSACDTGHGMITGEGIVGLSRSLLMAGASSVLVSLWKVPDSATQELMVEFHQNLQKNPDKAQALRQAMLMMSQKYQNPGKWAAFTLIGAVE